MKEDLLLNSSPSCNILCYGCLHQFGVQMKLHSFIFVSVIFFKESLKQKAFLWRPPHSLNYPIALGVNSLTQVPLLLNARWRVKRKHIKSWLWSCTVDQNTSLHWGDNLGSRSLAGCSATQLWGFLVLLTHLGSKPLEGSGSRVSLHPQLHTVPDTFIWFLVLGWVCPDFLFQHVSSVSWTLGFFLQPMDLSWDHPNLSVWF